jgi:hypothetical protein
MDGLIQHCQMVVIPIAHQIWLEAIWTEKH